MTEKIRMPADLSSISIKILGKFNAKDLLRLFLPISIGFLQFYQTQQPTTINYGIAGVSIALGLTWALWRPWNRTLDENLYHAIRWKTRKETESEEDNSISALIEVKPVNIELKSGSEKAALHKQFQELLKTVEYPVEIYTRQNPFDPHQQVQRFDESEYVEKAYKQRLMQVLQEDQEQTTHHVCIRSEAGESDELESRVEEVEELLNSGPLNAQQIGQPEEPEKAEIERDHLYKENSAGKQFSKTVYISQFPKDVDFSWTSAILNVEGLLDITQVINPKSSIETVSKLERLENKASAENDSLIRKGYGSSRKLERLLSDIDWFQNLLADQSDKPVQYGAYITAYGNSLEDCDSVLRNVQNRLKTLGIEYRSTGLRTDQALNTVTPGYEDQLGETLLVPSGSAASGFPFTSAENIDENGVLFGTEDTTGTPVILDRFKWNAGHQVIAGVTGSGKSFYSKLLLLRSSANYSSLQVNIVDPKDEYTEIAEKLQNHADVNRYHHGSELQDNVSELGESVADAYKQAQKHSGETIVVIDEAHRLLEKEEGASVLSTLVREARSSNTAVTLITQTINDFYKTEAGQDILKNIPCKALFAHEQADTKPGNTFSLSNTAENALYTLTKGDQDGAEHSNAVLSVSNQFESKIRVEASNPEKLLVENGEKTTLDKPIEELDDVDATSDDTEKTEPTTSEESSEPSTLQQKSSNLTLPSLLGLTDLPSPGKPEALKKTGWTSKLSIPAKLAQYQGRIRSATPILKMASHLILGFTAAHLIVLEARQIIQTGDILGFVLFVVTLYIVISVIMEISDFYDTGSSGSETA